MKPRIHFAQVAAPRVPATPRFLQHPFFAWLGLRPPLAQHTLAEHEALMRYSRNAQYVVEIGVAEGASAAGLREAMHPQGTLYLVDPYHLSRIPVLNFPKHVAHRAVNSMGEARIVWIEAFSHDAVRGWKQPIDFLFIDGDHREEAVERDWRDWSPFVTDDGVVAFHDARLFAPAGITPAYGPVRFINCVFRQDLGAAPWAIIHEVDSLVLVSRRKPS